MPVKAEKSQHRFYGVAQELQWLKVDPVSERLFAGFGFRLFFLALEVALAGFAFGAFA